MKIALIGLFLLMTACKKEAENIEDEKTPAQLLTQREWVLAAHGFDDNNNSAIDDWENIIEECQKDNTYVFNISGTGSAFDNSLSCGDPVNHNFVWQLLSNGSRIEIGHQPYVVLKLNEQELVLSPEIPGTGVKYILKYRH
jgi:hypothetical protein